MPIRTQVPVEGRITAYRDAKNITSVPGESVGTMDMEHFEFMYGASGVSAVTCHTDYEPDKDGTVRAFLTFVADTQEEQIILDAWAAQIDLDDVPTMRAKFADAPVVQRDGEDYKPSAVGDLVVDNTPEARGAIASDAG